MEEINKKRIEGLLSDCEVGDRVNLLDKDGAGVLRNVILTGVEFGKNCVHIALNGEHHYTLAGDYYQLELVSRLLDIVKIEDGFNVYKSLVPIYPNIVINELATDFYQIQSLNSMVESNSIYPALHLNTSFCLVGKNSMVEIQLPYGPINSYRLKISEEECGISMAHPLKKTVYESGWTQVNFDNEIRPILENLDYSKLKTELQKYIF